MKGKKMFLKEVMANQNVTIIDLQKATGFRIARLADILENLVLPDTTEKDVIKEYLGVEVDYVTLAEVKKNQAKVAEENTLFAIALDRVNSDAKAKGFGKGKGGSSRVECPKCKNDLVYGVSKYNGHKRAQCRKGCFSWIE